MNNSFVEISSVFIKDTSSLVHIYKHEKTNMRIVYFENNDEEYFFSFCFPTLPDNNKGIPHIVEHTVLSGSKRYQGEDPFKELDGVSVNTFMNAMTFSDATLYPASSKLFEDFKQIFEVYADAVFSPLLKKASFEKEGVKRSLSESGEINVNGIVLSEMLSSSFDKDTVLSRCIRNTLFKGTPYAYESGGEGEEIALLTYDEFIEFYKEHYDPCVCTLFLSGKANVLETLDILEDRYLFSYVPKTVRKHNVCYKKEDYKFLDFVKSPKDKIAYYQKENDESKPTAVLNYLTDIPSSDMKNFWILQIIEDALLGTAQSPLSHALEEAHLGGDISSLSGVSTSFPYLVFSLGIDDFKVKKNESVGKALERAKKSFVKILEGVVEKGIDEEYINASIKYYAFLIREDGGKKPHALSWTRRVLFPFIRHGENEETILDPLFITDTLEEIKKEYKENRNLFTDFIKHHILSLPCSLFMAIPSDNLKEDTLNTIKQNALLTYNKYDVHTKNKNDSLNTPLTEKNEIKTRCTLNELRQFFRKEEYEEENIHNARYIFKKGPTNGITYLSVLFDISDLSISELQTLSIINTFAFHVDVGLLSASDFTKELLKHCVKLTLGIKTITEKVDNSKVKAYLEIKAKMLNEELQTVLTLLSSILHDGKFQNVESVKNTLVDLIGSMNSVLTYSPESMFMTASCSVLSTKNYIQNQVSAFPLIKFLNSVKSKKAYEELGKNLKDIITRIAVRTRLIVHMLSDEKQDITTFVKSFDEGDYKSKYVRLVHNDEGNVYYSYPFAMSYNALAFNTKCDDVGLTLYSEILNSISLWKRIRLEGGAYGCGSSYMSSGGFVIYSFCDPNISKTYDNMFLSLHDEIDDDLDKYKILSLSDLGSVVKAPEDSALSLIRYLSKTTDEYRLSYIDRIINATKKDVLNARDSLISGECKKITLSSKERIIEELNNPNGIISVL